MLLADAGRKSPVNRMGSDAQTLGNEGVVRQKVKGERSVAIG